MVKALEQAIAEVERLPAEDQEQIGRTLLSHVEKLRALRAEIDKGIRSLEAGQGRESPVSTISSGKRTGRWLEPGVRRSGRPRRSTIAKGFGITTSGSPAGIPQKRSSAK